MAYTGRSRGVDSYNSAFAGIYSALPPSTLDVVAGPSTDVKNEYDIMKFVQNIAPIKPEELNEGLKWSFQMVGSRRKRHKQRTKKSLLSLKERRELGLFKLRRNGMKYKDFLCLHNLWKEYFKHHIDFSSLKRQNFSGNPDDSQLVNISFKLMKADYHGAILCVKKSICSSLIGKKGIVVFETKNTFQLLDEDDTLRIVPKEGSVFTLTVCDFTFTILGNQFCIKSSMRNSKKIKACINIDL